MCRFWNNMGFLTPVAGANPLAGKKLRYLIGADNPGEGHPDEITEVPYGWPLVWNGISIGYCNLFDENNTGQYGPYLKTSDTAEQYREGQIDPRGPGWEKNLTEQFALRKRQGFEYVELDNPDAYGIEDVLGAIDLAATYGLKVIAKNPSLLGNEDDRSPSCAYVERCYGVIVEKGCGTAVGMNVLRKAAGKPALPVWFVFFGERLALAKATAKAAKAFKNMSVTWSREGEYGSSEDVV